MTAIRMMRAQVREALCLFMPFWVALRWRVHRAFGFARPHRLGRPLVVSLTSYPPRYRTLLPTLQDLLMQSVMPDHLELWVTDNDFAALPDAVLALRAHGLSIRTCVDLRSYKKIVPALAAHPGAIIVTADDDAHYPRTWLEELVNAYDPGAKEVLCHRAHEMKFRQSGRPTCYREWTFDTGETAASRTIFPTGLGGVLYPPDVFIRDVTRRDLFEAYCPTADDVWLFWMASLNGARCRKIGPVRRFILWRGGQDVALCNDNLLAGDANDIQIDAMIAAYGVPVIKEAI